MEIIDELKALKEEYKNIFAELNAKLDNKIAELEKVEQQTSGRWKPELNERYWFIDNDGNTFSGHWDNDVLDNDRYKFGNVFKTEEEAEFAAQQLKVLAELKEYTDDDKEWNRSNIHWYIEYDTITECIEVNNCRYLRSTPFNLYFSSEEQVQKAINAIGEDKLKKYYFCEEK